MQSSWLISRTYQRRLRTRGVGTLPWDWDWRGWVTTVGWPCDSCCTFCFELATESVLNNGRATACVPHHRRSACSARGPATAGVPPYEGRAEQQLAIAERWLRLSVLTQEPRCARLRPPAPRVLAALRAAPPGGATKDW
jgi:hypothetical protein